MLGEHLEVIFFYMRHKRYAVSKMKTFIPPLDNIHLAEMQVTYELYFNSLLSLLDFVNIDLKQNNIITHFKEIVGGDDNYLYIRELRNSIIHRGLDISAAGTIIKDLNIVAPFAPQFIFDRSKNKKYFAFTTNLLNLVKITEGINDELLKICNELNILTYVPMTKEKHDERIINDPYIPEYAKKISLSVNLNYEQINKDLKDIHEERIRKYFNTDDLI